jgi:hypothetical protein
VAALRQTALQMLAPGRSPLVGLVQMDETKSPVAANTIRSLAGGWRSHQGKMLVVGAVEVEDGGGALLDWTRQTLSRTSQNQTGDFEHAPPSAVRAVFWMICRFTSARIFPQRGCKLNEPHGVKPLWRVHGSHHLRFVANEFCSRAATSPFVRD